MVKRALWFIVFLWMAACMVGVVREVLNQSGTRLWISCGIGLFIAAFGLLALQAAVGKQKPPADELKKPTDGLPEK